MRLRADAVFIRILIDAVVQRERRIGFVADMDSDRIPVDVRVVDEEPAVRLVRGMERETQEPTLTAARVEHAIDIVDVFRRSEFVGPIVDEAIRVKPRLIWLQVGVVDEAARARAAAAGGGIPFVMDRCLMVDHRLLEV